MKSGNMKKHLTTFTYFFDSVTNITSSTCTLNNMVKDI